MEEAHGGRTRELIVLTSLVVLATCGAMSAERLPLSPQQRENSIATTTAATTEKMIYVKPSSSIMLKRSPQDAWPQPSQQGPASEGDFLLLNGTAAESMASSSSSSSLAPADHEAESAELGQQQAAPDLSSLQLSSQEYLRHSFTVSLILTVAYTLVFLIGLLGNSFVVIIVCKSARMRTVTNYFIANLAFADILVLLFCLPATLVSNLFIPYILGLFVCKTVSYLQGVAVSASINTMVAVTMDRFLAICFPLDWHMSRRMVKWTISCIWLFSLCVSLPWALYFTLIPYTLSYQTSNANSNSTSSGGSNATGALTTSGLGGAQNSSVLAINNSMLIYVCAEDWPSERMGRLYFIGANLILLYLFPAIIIILCYLGIWLKIKRRNIPGDWPKGLKIEVIMQKSKLKVFKMMMVVVVLFLLSWLPLYLIWTRIKLADERSPWEDWLITNLMPLAQWLGASNSCINPILYTFFNRKYKKGFSELLKFTFCCKPINGLGDSNPPYNHTNVTTNQITNNNNNTGITTNGNTTTGTNNHISSGGCVGAGLATNGNQALSSSSLAMNSNHYAPKRNTIGGTSSGRKRPNNGNAISLEVFDQRHQGRGRSKCQDSGGLRTISGGSSDGSNCGGRLAEDVMSNDDESDDSSGSSYSSDGDGDYAHDVGWDRAELMDDNEISFGGGGGSRETKFQVELKHLAAGENSRALTNKASGHSSLMSMVVGDSSASGGTNNSKTNTMAASGTSCSKFKTKMFNNCDPIHHRNPSSSAVAAGASGGLIQATNKGKQDRQLLQQQQQRQQTLDKICLEQRRESLLKKLNDDLEEDESIVVEMRQRQQQYLASNKINNKILGARSIGGGGRSYKSLLCKQSGKARPEGKICNQQQRAQQGSLNGEEGGGDDDLIMGHKRSKKKQRHHHHHHHHYHNQGRQPKPMHQLRAQLQVQRSQESGTGGPPSESKSAGGRSSRSNTSTNRDTTESTENTAISCSNTTSAHNNHQSVPLVDYRKRTTSPTLAGQGPQQQLELNLEQREEISLGTSGSNDKPATRPTRDQNNGNSGAKAARQLRLSCDGDSSEPSLSLNEDNGYDFIDNDDNPVIDNERQSGKGLEPAAATAADATKVDVEINGSI